MRYQIKHVTRHYYDRPVFCEPLKLRLRARDDPQQRTVWHRLDIDPAPVGCAESLDLEGNRFWLAWFAETTLRMCVTASSVVDVQRDNPFDFLLCEYGRLLPWRPTPGEAALCEYYGREDEPSVVIADLAKTILGQVDGQTLSFAVQATAWVHANILCRPRLDCPPRPAAETVQCGEGACRDLAVLYNALCRAVGLPARFVSGYAYSDDEKASELHAWSEVYMPGAGWRGFDPSLGLAVGGQHVVLAAAKDPAEAAPSEGRFRGTNARSKMETQLIVRVVPESDAHSNPLPTGPTNEAMALR